MRSIDWAALFVCRVEKTRWPVSAAVITVCIVCQSRISPTMITSGSCRNMFLRASAKLGRVGLQLPLGDGRLTVGEQVLDGVFDGDDVHLPLLDDALQDRGEGRGLARPGGPRDEDETGRKVDEGFQHLGQVQILDRRQLERDAPENRGERAPLDVDVGPEPRHPRQPVAQVDGLVFFEPRPLRRASGSPGASVRAPPAGAIRPSGGRASPSPAEGVASWASGGGRRPPYLP